VAIVVPAVGGVVVAAADSHNTAVWTIWIVGMEEGAMTTIRMHFIRSPCHGGIALPNVRLAELDGEYEWMMPPEEVSC